MHFKVKREIEVSLEVEDLPEVTASLASVVIVDQLDPLDRQDHRDHPATQDHQGQGEKEVHRDLRGQLENLDQR